MHFVLMYRERGGRVQAGSDKIPTFKYFLCITFEEAKNKHISRIKQNHKLPKINL